MRLLTDLLFLVFLLVCETLEEYFFIIGQYVDDVIEDYLKPILPVLIIPAAFILFILFARLCLRFLQYVIPLLVDWIFNMLSHPAWQGIGAVVSVLALIVAIASMKKERG